MTERAGTATEIPLGLRRRAVAGSVAMNAKTAATVPAAEGHVLEPKFDGARIIYGDGVLYARSGNTHTGKVPDIERELAQLPPDTWLDGELVSLSIKDGLLVQGPRGDAQSVMGAHSPTAQVSRRMTYMVFDILAFDGHDMRDMPQHARRAFLERVFERVDFSRVALTVQMPATQGNYEALVRAGFEGAMVKAIHARYASGARSLAWQKVKAEDTLDAVVMGFKDGESGYTGLVGSLVFGQYNEDGDLVELGHVGSGLTMKQREDISRCPELYMDRVVEVRYMGRGTRGGVTHPVFVCFRDDKRPEECQIA